MLRLKTPEEASEGGNINIVAAKGAGNIWCCTFRWKDTEVYAFALWERLYVGGVWGERASL